MADVTVTGLTKRFGAFTAVNNISFEARSGHFVTLLGPSGCGKTTTLRMIAGLERPDGGEVRVGDRVLSSSERGIFLPPERRGMGMVFQSYAIWPHKTVFQNVAFPLEEQRISRPEIRERVMTTLGLVGLEGFADRPAPLLSGGQQQRVALARALVSNPQVLLLDEPLSNLDTQLREQMRFEIRTMQVRLGITTVFVTHDQLEAMTLSDHVIVMNSGIIDQRGTPREVYERPNTRFVMDFLGQVNHLPARVRTVNGAVHAYVGESVFPLPQDNGWRDGDDVVLAFRTEAVALATTGGQVRGTVSAATYVGGRIEYVVLVGEGSVRVVMPSDSQLTLGSVIGLNIAPGSAQVWRATPDADRAHHR